jgi:hypothetical protein
VATLRSIPADHSSAADGKTITQKGSLMPDKQTTSLEVSISDPDTQALLLRAREIDREAWSSPLHDHLATRRSESMKRAYAELKQQN